MFDGFVRYYDLDYGPFEDDIVFYRELARLADGRVLDAMCGTGRVTLPLALVGIPITGVDISTAMIERARDLAEQQGLEKKVQFEVGDVRALHLDQPFAMAFVAVNSFMHLETVAEQLQSLRSLHAQLQPHGLLVLDLFNPDPSYLAQIDGQMVLDKTFTIPASGHLVQKYVVRSVDLAEQYMQVTFCYDEIAANGQVSRTVLPFGMRWLYRFELEHLLARTGFMVEHMYGSYDLEPFDGAAERLLVVARRTTS